MKALAAALVLTIAAAAVAGQGTTPPIWQGVYTADQAERGKAVYKEACIRCHGGDLLGTTAPPLAGEGFMKAWGGESVSRLFEKIRDTMPPNFGTILDDRAKLDIVAHILQTNGYPAGSRDLAADRELAAIRILRKGEQAQVQNFALVQAVGCLARDANQWVLRSSSDPVVTTDSTPTDTALTEAAGRPLGTNTFVLLSTAPFRPADQQGQKVEARGLIYRDPAESLMTVTSLKTVGTCGQ